jgi:hypothetical protein
MLYYYKRPGDWFWRSLDIASIEAAARGHRVGGDWRYRVEGDSTNRTLAELIDMERLARERISHTPSDPSFTAPDATWGYITVALCFAALTFLMVVPSQQPQSGGKFLLTGMVLIWMSYGIQKISAARAWKRCHRPHPKPNQSLEPTAGRRDD